MAVILIIDDDDALRAAVATAIADMKHTPIEAANGDEALARFAAQRPDAVLLDLRMPGMGGLDVLRWIRGQTEPPPVIVVTAAATSANTIEAMRLGAFDHVEKPLGRDALRRLLERAVPTAVTPAIAAAPDEGDELIGVSPAMRDVQKAIGMLADGDVTVLIRGETGVGKEIVARALHRHGRRASGPFIALNCASIPEELLESELFGHSRGSFTGAIADRIGSFREADGGTLFLDEIGDMSLPLQAKLLRVLEERVVNPVGGKPVRIDVRVIVATHRDLLKAIDEGRFREDLYYRVGIVPIVIPPLRERQADIAPLAVHFLRAAAKDGQALTLADDALARLNAYRWPGNVRELRNAMARLSALVRARTIQASDLDFLQADAKSVTNHVDWLSGTLNDAVSRLEREMIRRALQRTDGNRARAAELLGIRRQLLYDKIGRYGLDAALSEKQTGDVRETDDTHS